MRVDITPTRTTATPGSPVVLTVTVANTTDIISGHQIRVLGVDPRWVNVSQPSMSLFPGTTGTSVVTLKLPPGLPAGRRRISVQVRQLTVPESATVVDVDLDLPAVHRVDARMEPGSITAGRRASFGMIVGNSGNTPWIGTLEGSDEEGRVSFGFTPPVLDLVPGEHAAVDVAVSGRRRLFGSLVVRPLTVSLLRYEDASDAEPTKVGATFLQRPVLGRGALSLLGLLAAVTVFALVITYALSGVVGRSSADRDLALQVAQAQQAGNAVNSTGAMSGRVRLLTSGSGVPGVTVEVFSASDTATSVTSSATDTDGGYTLSGLPAGSYKLRFRGAGFAELWYPQALTDSDATTIDLQTGQVRSGLDVRLGGLPATIAGVVTGADPTGATVALLRPGTGTPAGGGSVASTVTSVFGSHAGDGATVQSVKVGGDGSFLFANVPSPSVYDLSVSKPGFATQVERVDVGGGEQRTGLEIRLRQGDGIISGIVSDRNGPLGDASISAQFAGTTVETLSLTERRKAGQFILRGLPTPGTFTIVVAAQGYASQTLSLTLTPGQQLTGVGVTLGGVSGGLSGQVTTTVDGAPAGGVTVTVTNGTLTVVTVTNSRRHAGRWSLSGLPLPDTYTVTFSRADLAPQTLAVSLDPFGLVTGSGGATAANSVDAALTSSTATLFGRTLQVNSAGVTEAVPEVLVSVTSGSSTYELTSATLPSTQLGGYEFDSLPPGTYTITVSARGARPTSQIVTLTAGTRQPLDLTLAAPAGVHGVAYDAKGNPVAHAEVRLYLASEYPNTSIVTTEADDQGRFRLTNLDAPQNYVLEYDYPAGSTPRASKTFTLKQSTDLQVDLRPSP